MDQKISSSPNDVKKFLKELKNIINSNTFDSKKHFMMSNRKNDLSTDIYSNHNTLLMLNFTYEDVINEISKLSFEDYIETIIDTVGNECLLFVFKKNVKGEKIYIKLSIRDNKKIICISFHISRVK